MIRAETWYP